MLDLEVIDEPAVAACVLDSVRARVLAELVEPGSATTVATAIGESRQKVNYHLRSLEALGLVQLIAERKRRGLVERVVQASAKAYVLSPELLGASACDPEHVDGLSSRYLIAVASRMVREVADLAARADAAEQPLATLAIDTEVRFATAGDRSDFTRELANAVAALSAKYHDETADGGRWHRLVVAAHPSPPPKKTTSKAVPPRTGAPKTVQAKNNRKAEQ